MRIFTNEATRQPSFQKMLTAIRQKLTPANLIGLSGIHKAHYIAAAAELLQKPVLVITEDELTARRMCEDICALHQNPLELTQGEKEETFAAVYPAHDLLFHSIEGASSEYSQQRIAVLSQVSEGKLPVVLTSYEAFLQYTIPPKELSARSFMLKAGQSWSLDTLTEKLSRAGYVRRPQIEGTAQYALRGGILDVFPCEMTVPVRIEFWGDEIDSIAQFELDSQRRTEVIDTVNIVPALETLFDSADACSKKLSALLAKTRSKKAKEALYSQIEALSAQPELCGSDRYLPIAYEKNACLFDYYDDCVVFFCEYNESRTRLRDSSWQLQEDIAHMLEEGELCPGMDSFAFEPDAIETAIFKRPTILIDTFAHSARNFPIYHLITCSPLQTSGWSGEWKVLTEDLAPYLRQNYTVLVMAGTPKAAAVLAADLARENIPATFLHGDAPALPGMVSVLSNTLSGGFEYPESKTILFTLQRRSVTKARRNRHKAGKQLRSLTDLHPGDYVVHNIHGIGIFEGIETLKLQGVTKDYIKIEYAAGATLHIPVTQLDMITKYIGPKDEKRVKINRLNSGEWNKTKSKVKTAVTEMADELIRLYAERAKVKGYVFSPDTEWQKEFEERFEYPETEDQLRCIAEIKQDMESEIPMDRLLCGDVGFGKTEVAIRAAFKCVMDDKQCALLCPTTILAWQHYQNLLRRIGNFPIRVELLSRFCSPKQIHDTVNKLRTGEVNIVVGTHRLLQKDIHFHDLGLAIIDEEQRFGVAHKERFKELFRGVDMLSLSATPIPRTLNMALTGIRDMSTIDEPPQDRFPVQTYVLEHDDGVIAEAIRKELRRGGQVYYIHNRVSSIEQAAARLAEQIPTARIGVAHGQMSEQNLSFVWRQLLEREIDILVCTTIIETGVDVPNCNTLIIENADYMGLSQLYQLRGRIGRSTRRAFAYFTFRRDKSLSEVAQKRLTAIREFTKFGSGFNIAMRDLEIRGAGNILGTKQHGHMEAVGYDMYLKMLSDAVSEKKGEKVKEELACSIDVRADAHLPESYIEDINQRIDIYHKIAAIRNGADASDVLDELVDRFGDPPASVENLVYVALIKSILSENNFFEVRQQANSLLLYPLALDDGIVKKLIGVLGTRVTATAGLKPYIAVKCAQNQPAVETLKETAAALLGVKSLSIL